MSNGITYFPLDVHMDDNIELIEAEFGLTGFAVIVKLYQKIYGDLGYYCEWTNDVALLFTRRVGCSAVSEIVAAAIRRGIFDEGLYQKYQILTSRGIQKRYFDVVSRRKEVTVKKEYLLVEVAQKYNNVNISEENVNISSENACISEQRKEKESKGKESKVNYQRIADLYNDTCVSLPRCEKLSVARKKSIQARLNSGYSFNDFKNVFDNAENSRFLKGGNDRNWKANFDWLIKDSNMAKVLEGNYADRNNNGSPSPPKTRFNNFEQNDCDISQLEQAALKKRMEAG